MAISRSIELVVGNVTTTTTTKKLTTIYTGCSNWEREPNESKRINQSQAVNTFCFKDIFSRGRPRIKRATVFASRPDPKSDLIYLRFYVYSYNEDSRRVSDQQLSNRNVGSVSTLFTYGSRSTVITRILRR